MTIRATRAPSKVVSKPISMTETNVLLRSSPARERMPSWFEMKIMDTIKTAAIMFIAVGAYLIVLPTSDSDKADFTGSPLPLKTDNKLETASEMSARVKSGLNATVESQVNRPVAKDIPVIPNGVDDQVQLANWPLILYPELAQIAALENLPVDAAVGELLPMLSNTNAVVRLAALEALSEMNHHALLPIFSAALDDPEPQVRIVALQALGSLDEPMALSSIEPYLFDHETDVRLAAIEALADLEYEQAAQTLASLLSDQDANIRHQVVNALGEIGGEQAIAYLRQARVDPDADIRANAITILDELGETAW